MNPVNKGNCGGLTYVDYTIRTKVWLSECFQTRISQRGKRYPVACRGKVRLSQWTIYPLLGYFGREKCHASTRCLQNWQWLSKRQVSLKLCSRVLHVECIHTSHGSHYWTVTCTLAVYSCGLGTPHCLQASQAFSSRSAMYSCTQVSLGSAQSCRFLLVRKMTACWEQRLLVSK